MATLRRPRTALLAAAALAVLAPLAAAQSPPRHHHPAPGGHGVPEHVHLVVPTRGAFAPSRRTPQPDRGVVIESVDARTVIRDAVATTVLDVHLRNSGSRQAEAVLLLPLPWECVISGFDFEGAASEPTATLLPRAEARSVYDSIVAQVRDPALLEFVGWNLVRSSVFPVAPRGTQQVRLVLEHLLPVDGDRIDLVLPRSASLDCRVPWTVTVDVESSASVVDVFSPSHDLHVIRHDDHRRTVRLHESERERPGAFRMSVLLARSDRPFGVGASVVAAPDPSVGGGHFMVVAGLDEELGRTASIGPREISLVIDRSGSMAGEKLRQARAAAHRLLKSLRPDDRFNLIAYSNGVTVLFDAPQRRTPEALAAARAFVDALVPAGGTNIHGAVVTALRQPAAAAEIRSVILLTDGLPTVGRTRESDVRAAIERGNPGARRVHTIGIGHDVNVPLLDRLAVASGGTSAVVSPGASLDESIARIVRRLRRPALVAPELVCLDGEDRVTDVLPHRLPDLFAGDQVVVLGRYLDDTRPIRLALRGALGGSRISVRVTLDPAAGSIDNAYVSRLWAGRRIATLVDRVRQDAPAHLPAEALAADPRFQPLVQEIVDLSIAYGILTEYTAFLATEGTSLRDVDSVVAECTWNLKARAVDERSGTGAVAQGLNQADRSAGKLNLQNRMLDATMQVRDYAAVQQVADRGFFRRGQTWVDGTLVQRGLLDPTTVVEYGSDDHRRLLDRLVGQNRQACLALRGDVLLEVDGAPVLVRQPATP